MTLIRKQQDFKKQPWEWGCLLSLSTSHYKTSPLRSRVFDLLLTSFPFTSFVTVKRGRGAERREGRVCDPTLVLQALPHHHPGVCHNERANRINV